MELLEGETLQQRLARLRRLSMRETREIVKQVARALIKAHDAGIIHRDIKPENVFLLDSEPDTFVKILDFGIAKHVDEQDASGVVLGTPHFMAPEQIRGEDDEIGAASDVWSLAVVAYQCATGHLPYEGETLEAIAAAIEAGPPLAPSRICRDVQPGFDAWFARALAKSVSDRFATMREMLEALESVRDDGLVSIDVEWIDDFGACSANDSEPPASPSPVTSKPVEVEVPATLRSARLGRTRTLPVSIDEPPSRPSGPSIPDLPVRSGFESNRLSLGIAVLALVLGVAGGAPEQLAQVLVHPSAAAPPVSDQAPAAATRSPDPTEAVTAPPSPVAVANVDELPAAREAGRREANDASSVPQLIDRRALEATTRAPDVSSAARQSFARAAALRAAAVSKQPHATTGVSPNEAPGTGLQPPAPTQVAPTDEHAYGHEELDTSLGSPAEARPNVDEAAPEAPETPVAPTQEEDAEEHLRVDPALHHPTSP
jgi:serine/threonine-protein kinase